MRRVRPTAARVARSVALAAAIATLALSLRSAPELAVLLGALAAAALLVPLVEWEAPPPRLVRLLPRVNGLLLLVVTLVGWLTRSLAVLVLDATLQPTIAGPAVVLPALAFALAPRSFPPGPTLVLTTIFLVGLAGLDPTPAGYGPTLLPFLRGTEHNGFAEVYLALAIVVLAALWTSALVDGGPRWSRRHALVLGLVGTLAVALAATGVVGLPLLQPRVEKAFAAAFDQGTTGLSGESTLGEFAELGVSRRRVLDLEASVDGGRWLLRSEVFTAFDGRRWSSPALPATRAGGKPAPRKRALLRPVPPPPAVGPLLARTGAWFSPTGDTTRSGAAGVGERAEEVELRVVQVEVGRWPLLLPGSVTAVTAEVPYLEVDRFGAIRRPGGLPIRLYGAVVPAAPLRAGSPELTDAEREESLGLPATLDERLTSLAARLAPAGASPRERLRATVAHLDAGYTYTLRPGPFRTGDPVAEFLFEKKAGYCEYFASAAVLLLRLQRVPARYVKGLSVGPQNHLGGGLHVVREGDAHAWVEAWLPGEGWVEADPTPPGQFAAAHAPPDRIEALVQRARAAFAAAWARLTALGPLAFLEGLLRDLAGLAARAAREPLAWLLVAGLALGPRLLRSLRARRRRRRPALADEGAAVPRELRDLVLELERRWRDAGRPRPPGRGLREHAVGFGEAGGGTAPPALGEAGPRLVDLYYGARYGGQAPDGEEIARLRSTLRG